MYNGILKKNQFINEKVLSYEQGSKERAELEIELAKIKNSLKDIPIIIGGEEIRTGMHTSAQ
jgi:1-pyrroline-5-carboxylate dehydrogenase